MAPTAQTPSAMPTGADSLKSAMNASRKRNPDSFSMPAIVAHPAAVATQRIDRPAGQGNGNRNRNRNRNRLRKSIGAGGRARRPACPAAGRCYLNGSEIKEEWAAR